MANKLKLRVAARFLASIFNGIGTVARKDGLATYVDLDFTQFTQLTTFDSTTEFAVVQSSIDGSFAKVSLAGLLSASQTTQIITGTGVVNVSNTDGLIILNGTAPYTVNLPASASKVGRIKIVDWAGNVSAASPVTVNSNGTEKFNGNTGTWLIEAAGASVVFDPIPTGIGYAV
jgi:hypothetical protein